MEFTHMAVGRDPLDRIRVDVLWTPKRDGVEVNVRDAGTRVSYGIWRTIGREIWREFLDDESLHLVVWLALGVIPERAPTVEYALDLARQKGLKWVPEKLG
ncbi:hypothetical protein ABT160_04490 [Streptomyces sp. NPDC001941]|uniref:hypothetical protein n=1 Tax=Streptomyces sp. NPDC001941 TaxID=3154659 RepID=UPI003323C624